MRTSSSGTHEQAAREAEIAMGHSPVVRAPRLVRALRAAGRSNEAKRVAWKYAGRDVPPDSLVSMAYLAVVADAPDRARAQAARAGIRL